MKLLFCAILAGLLAGCKESTSESALVNITCYNMEGIITMRTLHYRGPIQMVNDPSLGYRSEKCVIERAD